MQIVGAELIGYKRTKLNGTKRIVMTLVEIIQVILGTNGAGKSSLMRELSPWPAAKNDYWKTGSKTITIINGTDHYVLRSWFNPSQRHSFKMNGVELNGTDGGTLAQQKDLVWEHFKINGDIRDLQVGRIRFSDMDTAERRKWLMMLADGDYTFALSVYGKLKKESSDIEAVLKHVKKRLAIESEKVIKPEEERMLNNEVNQIHQELNILMESRAPVTHPSGWYKDQNENTLRELNALSNKLIRMKLITPYSYHCPDRLERDDWGEIIRPHYTTVEQIDVVIDQLRSEIIGKEATVNGYFKQHTKASEQLKKLHEAGEASFAEMSDQVMHHVIAFNETVEKRRLKIDNVNPRDGIAAIFSAKMQLADMIDSIPANHGQEYGQGKMDAANARCTEIKNTITDTDRRLKARIASKDHMEQHKGNQHTECPQCNHRWNLMYDENKISTLNDEIAKLDAQMFKLRKELETQETIYETNRNYGEKFRAIHRTFRSIPILSPFWDHIHELKLLTENPRRIMHELTIFNEDLELSLEAEKHRDAAESIRKLMATREELGDLTIAKVRQEVEEYAILIEELTSSLNTLQLSMSEHQAFKRQLVEMTTLMAKIAEMRNNAWKIQTEMVEMMRRETIQQCIRQLQGALARKEEVLTYKAMVKATVEDLQDQVTQQEVQLEAAKMLVAQLSPNEGLIADGLVNFINSFLKRVNGLIRKVWTHSLVVQSCAIDGEIGAELNYKFPVCVQEDPDLTPDVSECSEGEKEIIDLAFRVVALKCLGLERGPLYLDEFAKSFVAEHRQAAIAVITTLMETKPFTQLFMVSHYEESYSVFNNAEFCVLSPASITVPGNMEYNKHVIIE